jgi:two-component system, NarL family, response regulator NreC
LAGHIAAIFWLLLAIFRARHFTFRLLLVQIASGVGTLIQVLIADDHEMIRIGVRTLLKARTDIEVHEASNGAEAIGKALTIRPDLVILDLTMPIKSGFQVAKELRRLVPEIPILVFTIHSGSRVVEQTKLLGVQGYLNKSDAAKMLLTAVSELVEHNGTFFPDPTDSEPVVS